MPLFQWRIVYAYWSGYIAMLSVYIPAIRFLAVPRFRKDLTGWEELVSTGRLTA